MIGFNDLDYQCVYETVVTREMKLFRNNLEISSVHYYFTRNHIWNCNKFISAAERVLKLFRNYYLGDAERVGKYPW